MNFTGSVAKSGAMTPRDWAELSRTNERAGHREMKCTGSLVEPVPQSLQELSVGELLRNLETSASSP